MANMSSLEKHKVEKLLEMGSGYILDFSNRTIQEFVLDNAGLDIYNNKYEYASGSKANRMRALWQKESNYVVGNLIGELLEYWKTYRITSERPISEADQILFEECLKIAGKLKQQNAIENIDVLETDTIDKDFEFLAKSIRESISKNEPEGALDRLHTYTVRYLRKLCEKRNITYDKNTPLQSLLGAYIKYLRNSDLIESEMTERILKSSISILDAFNDVRNNHSFAHGNPVLNYNESNLIFNGVLNVLKFIESIEQKQDIKVNQKEEEIDPDYIPF